MTTALLITADAGLRARLLGVLSGASVFSALGDDEALKTLRVVAIEVVIRDSRGPVQDLAAFVERAREVAPSSLIVAVGPEDGREAADFVLSAGFDEHDLDRTLRQLEERRRLQREVQALRALATPAPPGPPGDSASNGPALTRILREFGRVFAAGFDLSRVLEMVLDAIGELLRPTRSALLLQQSDGVSYRVRAHRALPPAVVDAARLSATHGLGRWLALEGRPARLQDMTDPGLIADLKLLGGVLAVPLLTHGELVAILIVGHPVIDDSYGRRDTEVLFDLATHLATAIRDITLHHQLQHRKEFSERILAHMSSGVVTIGRDERVSTMNRRAEEILGLAAAEVVGRDLRALPSPLGDMLYETLAHGRALPRSEIQLALRSLWLEVSTYPVRGDEAAPLGAVLVFEDHTAQKELAAQKRQAQEFQLLARVIARIADEIKNPLVSINTFVELLEERYEDPEFRKLFSSVVRRDMRRLVQVFEKLAGLVSEGELDFLTVDAQEMIDEVVTAIELADDGLGKRLQIDVRRDGVPLPIRVDPVQFRKALSYLLWYLTHNSPGEEARLSVSFDRHAECGTADEVQILIGSRTASVPAETLERIFDPVRMVQESLIDVGPAVSQRLVEAQGGRLKVNRNRGELGFALSMPLVQT